MAVRLAKGGEHGDIPTREDEPSSRLTCAFVNNMPDGAFAATERQFLDLLDEASGSDDICVRRYTMSDVPRGEGTASRIAEQYLPLVDVRMRPPDVLIITGSNPIEVRIQDEPYWLELVELLSWARENVRTMLLSCLSAHAALTVFDGIRRVRLPTKCTGVFSQDVEVNHPLADGIESKILLPHSRWNSAPRESLEGAGYQIMVHSVDTGWSVATREENGLLLVLVQGHPEYDPSSLLREYRRDARRYVHRENNNLPYLPYHCVSPEDWGRIEGIHREIIEGDRDPLLIDQYPFDEVGERASWPWHAMARRLYANWLSSVSRGKD